MSDMINKYNPLQTMKPLSAAVLLAVSPLASIAASPVVPGAGDILQQVSPLLPPAFSTSGTGLTIERADGTKLPQSAPFLVKSILITGNTLFDTPTLHALVAVKKKTMPAPIKIENAMIKAKASYYSSFDDLKATPPIKIENAMIRTKASSSFDDLKATPPIKIKKTKIRAKASFSSDDLKVTPRILINSHPKNAGYRVQAIGNTQRVVNNLLAIGHKDYQVLKKDNKVSLGVFRLYENALSRQKALYVLGIASELFDRSVGPVVQVADKQAQQIKPQHQALVTTPPILINTHPKSSRYLVQAIGKTQRVVKNLIAIGDKDYQVLKSDLLVKKTNNKVSLGVFSVYKNALSRQKALSALGIASELFDHYIGSKAGYLVQAIGKTQRVVNNLIAKGDNGFQVLKSDHQVKKTNNKVSLGVFSVYENALSRQKTLAAFGIASELFDQSIDSVVQLAQKHPQPVKPNKKGLVVASVANADKTLAAEAEGESLNLAQLGELAARITSYYRSHGYPLARAIIPAQTIAAGVVRIEVIEARYGKISVGKNSRVKDTLLQATLAPLQSGQVIGQSGLDRALLLVSDIPGVVVGATLKPGQVVGTSDLLVSTTPGPTVTGNVVSDNYGNRITGRERIGSTVNFINPLQHGDVLSLSVLSSGGGLNYGRLGYETLLNGQGTRLGGSYSTMRYELGAPLEDLQANGSARVSSLWAKHPFVRSRDVNLYGQLQFNSLQLRDHIDASAIKTDRSLDNWTLSLTGDARDGFLSGGSSTWSLGWTTGRVGFDSVNAQLNDAGTEGGFSKWNASLARLQGLSPNSGLYLAFSGQWANGNLDASQKISVGGPFTVRAYDASALSGDTGYLATAELRHAFGTAWNGQWQAVAFVDAAHVTVNKNSWDAGTNSATLSGAGVGISYTGLKQWRAKTYIATGIGAVPTLVSSSDPTRVWVEISKGF
jgi:hemolysin activation/secretion protein